MKDSSIYYKEQIRKRSEKQQEVLLLINGGERSLGGMVTEITNQAVTIVSGGTEPVVSNTTPDIMWHIHLDDICGVASFNS